METNATMENKRHQSAFSAIDLAGQFANLLANLHPAQRRRIIELGFGDLFEMHSIQISRALIVDMVDVYDSTSQSFYIGEKHVPITPQDVSCILGLRDEGKIVRFDKKTPKDELAQIFEDPSKGLVTFDYVRDLILRTDARDDNFTTRMFIILMVAEVLAPPLVDYIPYEYLNFVDLEDISQVSKINWAEFTVHSLIEGIEKHLLDKKRRIQGSVFFLQLFYYEHVRAGAMDEDAHFHPLMCKWTRERVRIRNDHHRMKGRFVGEILVQLNCTGKKGSAPPSKTSINRGSTSKTTTNRGSTSKRIIDGASDGPNVKILSQKRAKMSNKQPGKTPQKEKETKYKHAVDIFSDASDTEGVIENSDASETGTGATDISDPKSTALPTPQQLAAIWYLEDAKLDEEIVRNDKLDVILTVKNIQSLIQDSNKNSSAKWIPSQVINCYIATLDSERHASLKVMAVTTHNTDIYSRSVAEDTTNNRRKRNYMTVGKEFLEHDLVFFPINVENSHWLIGILNFKKSTFQILDSLLKRNRAYYEDLTRNLRTGIQRCITLAIQSNDNLSAKHRSLNITTWPVNVISQAPQQNDSCSCGVYALAYIEYWKGSIEMTNFPKVDIEQFQKQILVRMIFSDVNKNENIKTEIKEKYKRFCVVTGLETLEFD
ncbi:Epstein-Barr virus EBNA-1-like protein [Rhynchospora pubera]|uniref:Epstein-Barr virus EBNA-1-like protein n=1 Tax=Rhynchospora pubera TaxID=906938 RepID=A0AAV8FYQ1_9POAL|nr:Epstein-Barr virus EBNA-1-like protein [Rhynchospora pubera]